jgi:hypothetical protein
MVEVLKAISLKMGMNSRAVQYWSSLPDHRIRCTEAFNRSLVVDCELRLSILLPLSLSSAAAIPCSHVPLQAHLHGRRPSISVKHNYSAFFFCAIPAFCIEKNGTICDGPPMDRAVHWSYWLIESERLKLFPISFH